MKGFTLVEILVVLAIVSIIGVVIASFQGNLFSINDFLQQSLSIQRDAEAVAQGMVSQLRTAAQSDTGGYPIEQATENAIAFYANIDSDSAKERVHYFLSGTTLKKSIVNPAGNPLTYSTSTAQEMLSVVLTNVVASSTAPLFSYYDSAYAGTSTPLAQPANVLLIRLVNINIIVDKDPNRLPPPANVSTQVNIRNLKDNL